MKNKFTLLILFSVLSLAAYSQKGNTVLIETFSETGCSACSQYDSAYQAVTKANADKIAIINYHCFFVADSLYAYNKLCDQKYTYYNLRGFPGAMINGEKPKPTSNHLTYVTTAAIEKQYNTEKQFDLNLTFTPTGGENDHSATIEVNAKALKDFTGRNLRLFVVITENNINYEERFKSKPSNGINHYDHIMRAYLPDSTGSPIKGDKAGKVSSVKLSYTNDDKNIDYKEVRVVAFIRDMNTKKIIASATKNESPFN